MTQADGVWCLLSRAICDALNCVGVVFALWSTDDLDLPVLTDTNGNNHRKKCRNHGWQQVIGLSALPCAGYSLQVTRQPSCALLQGHRPWPGQAAVGAVQQSNCHGKGATRCTAAAAAGGPAQQPDGGSARHQPA
jgi:hypothetical protein